MSGNSSDSPGRAGGAGGAAPPAPPGDSDYIPIDEEDEDSDTDSDDSSSYRNSNKPSPAAMTVIVHVRDFVLQTWGPDRHFVHISVRENYYVMRPAEKKHAKMLRRKQQARGTGLCSDTRHRQKYIRICSIDILLSYSILYS